jgi:class 3 adenylate cyclase
MSDHGHRTFVGTLVFLDVLDPRHDALDCVQDAAARAVGHLESEDVVSVPHPRGLVLVFPGDPEDGLFVALGLRDALDHEAAGRTDFGTRMSIHLGPVRIVEGVAQGEGPTVGAQLAGVAAPGQILASRSFYEVVSSLSVEHKALLHPVGRAPLRARRSTRTSWARTSSERRRSPGPPSELRRPGSPPPARRQCCSPSRW